MRLKEMYYRWPTDISAQQHSNSPFMLHSAHATQPLQSALALTQKFPAQISQPQILLEKALLQWNGF